MSKYLEQYPDALTGTGLFSQISSLPSIPWYVDDATIIQSLEIAYAMHSGERKLVTSFLSVSVEKRPYVVAAYYLQKWKRIWDDYIAEYSQLDPYHVVETGSHNENVTGNETTEHGHKIEESGTDTGSVGSQGTSNSETARNVYGFNSSEPVPAETGDTNTADTSTETRDLAATRDTEHSGTDTKTSTEGVEYEYNSDKRGSFGYHSPQDLLKRDIELWKATYFSIVFSDIDDLIMNKIYNI